MRAKECSTSTEKTKRQSLRLSPFTLSLQQQTAAAARAAAATEAAARAAEAAERRRLDPINKQRITQKGDTLSCRDRKETPAYTTLQKETTASLEQQRQQHCCSMETAASRGDRVDKKETVERTREASLIPAKETEKEESLLHTSNASSNCMQQLKLWAPPSALLTPKQTEEENIY